MPDVEFVQVLADDDDFSFPISEEGIPCPFDVGLIFDERGELSPCRERHAAPPQPRAVCADRPTGLTPNQGLIGARGDPKQALASDDVGRKLGVKKMPEPFGVEGQFCSVHKRANAIFLRLWGVLLFVQLFNPSRTFLGFLKVKQSCVQDAGRVDFAEVGFDDLGTRIQFLKRATENAKMLPDTMSILFRMMTLANSTWSVSRLTMVLSSPSMSVSSRSSSVSGSQSR